MQLAVKISLQINPIRDNLDKLENKKVLKERLCEEYE